VSNVPLLGGTNTGDVVGRDVGGTCGSEGDFVGTVVGDAIGSEGDEGGAAGGKVGVAVGATTFTRCVALFLIACCINVFMLWAAYIMSKFEFGTSAAIAVFAKEYENCMNVPASVCSP
jgi:hypothetical protein